MLYRVRNGYAVHLPGGQGLAEGEVFEPSPEILEGQGWKIMPVDEEEASVEVNEKAPKKPPRDRAMKPSIVRRKRGA